MTDSLDLKALEQKAFLSYHQDGIIDICLGGALLSLALAIWLLPEFWYFTVGGLIVWIFVYMVVKRSITAPRLGYVEFSKMRQRRTQYIFLGAMLVLVIFSVLGMIAWIYPPLGILIFESSFTILIVGLLGVLFFGFIGLISNIWRFYLYGIVLMGSAIVTFIFPVFLLIPLVVTSIMVLVCGVILVYRFMQRYPKQSTGEVAGA